MAVLLCACNAAPEAGGARTVASAFGEDLYWADLRKVIPVDSQSEDSLAMANSFISSWLTDQTILANARNTLSEEDLNLEERINDYRNSLLMYEFERRWVRQKMDTMIHADSVQSYYSRNHSKFKLKEDVVQLRWFMLPERPVRKEERRFLQLMKSTTPEEQSELEQLLAESQVAFVDYDGAWQRLVEVLEHLPFEEDDLKRSEANRIWTIHGEEKSYFVQLIADRAVAGEAPLEMVDHEIRAILLNQKKAQLLDAMRSTLYKDALEKGNIKIHE